MPQHSFTAWLLLVNQDTKQALKAFLNHKNFGSQKVIGLHHRHGNGEIGKT